MANSVSFALSDLVLNHLVCDSCQKYLSVTPVKIYPNRKVKCGRCSTLFEEEENGVDSLYNKIAEKSIFKCVNRFDGCMHLLRSSEVIEHELACISKKHTCPICFEEIFSYLMIAHFKFYHAKSLLDTPCFMEHDIMNLRQHYLYQSDNYLFFIIIKLSDAGESTSGNSRTFSLNLSPFGEDRLVKSFKANFIHFDEDSKKQVSSSSKCTDFPMTCSVELDVTSISTLAVTFCVEIVEPNGGIKHITQNNIKDEENDLNSAKNSSTSSKNDLIMCKNNDLMNIHKIMKDAIGNSLKILCFQQRNILPNEAFRKSVSDLTIEDKATITFTKSYVKYTVTLACHKCFFIFPTVFKSDIPNVAFIEDNNHYYLNCHFCTLKTPKTPKKIMILDEFNNINFFCIWGCSKYFNFKQLYDHERICEKQIPQKCPLKSCFYYSKLFELESHFQEQHSTINFGQLKFNSRLFYINLKISEEPVEHIIFIWCICVHVKFEYKHPFWEVSLSHEIPQAKIKAVLENEKHELIFSFLTRGFFRHYDNIKIGLCLINL